MPHIRIPPSPLICWVRADKRNVELIAVGSSMKARRCFSLLVRFATPGGQTGGRAQAPTISELAQIDSAESGTPMCRPPNLPGARRAFCCAAECLLLAQSRQRWLRWVRPGLCFRWTTPTRRWHPLPLGLTRPSFRTPTEPASGARTLPSRSNSASVETCGGSSHHLAFFALRKELLLAHSGHHDRAELCPLSG